MSSNRVSSGPVEAKYFRQIATVVVFGLPVFNINKRENGTHWLPPPRPSCTGLSQLGTNPVWLTPLTVMSSSAPSIQLNPGILPISAAHWAA